MDILASFMYLLFTILYIGIYRYLFYSSEDGVKLKMKCRSDSGTRVEGWVFDPHGSACYLIDFNPPPSTANTHTAAGHYNQ